MTASIEGDVPAARQENVPAARQGDVPAARQGDVPADPRIVELDGLLRPRWRPEVPVLWRSATAVQLGDDVIVSPVDRDQVTWMTTLDGLRTTDEVIDDLPLPATQAGRLLRAMIAAGALDDAARLPQAVRWAGPWEREPASRRFGALLSTTRAVDDAHAAMERRDRVRVRVIGSGDVLDHTRTALHAAGLAESHDAPPTVIVLADAPHPDVPAHFDRPELDLPHLHVGVLGTRAVVGPLVIPGRTSCLRCAHLHRRDADPCWPLLAVQWAHAVAALAVPAVDPMLARMAGDFAAVMLRTWSDFPGDPERWADAAIEVRLPDGRTTRLGRPPHPLCGCRW